MVLITILLIFIFILMIILFAIGLKYPRGRDDWPLDRRTTASIFLSITVFLLLIILSFFASQHIKWPSNTELFFYIAIIILVILVITSILLPKGLSVDENMRSER